MFSGSILSFTNRLKFPLCFATLIGALLWACRLALQADDDSRDLTSQDDFASTKIRSERFLSTRQVKSRRDSESHFSESPDISVPSANDVRARGSAVTDFVDDRLALQESTFPDSATTSRSSQLTNAVNVARLASSLQPSEESLELDHLMHQYAEISSELEAKGGDALQAALDDPASEYSQLMSRLDEIYQPLAEDDQQ